MSIERFGVMQVSGWRLSGLLVAGVVTAVAVTGSLVVSGEGGGADETVFIPVEPCRLIDTRPGPNNIGPRATPIGEDDPVAFTAWDTDDDDSLCEIPDTATAISTNTTIDSPTANSWLSLWPADAAWPGTSNLNYVAGQSATPNAVTTPLSAAAGAFNVYNKNGTVHVIIDIVGYYQPSTNVGATGPVGPQGDPGNDGDTGDDGDTGAKGDTGVADGSACVVGGQSGTISVGSDGDGLMTLRCFRGNVTTFAGTGSVGSADGTGTAASFKYPGALAVDGSGNLFVADTNNHLIRKIN
jgi:hypothetical protein